MKNASDIYDKFVVSGRHLIGYNILGDENYQLQNDDFNEECLRTVIRVYEIENEIDVLLDFLKEKEIKGKPYADTLKEKWSKKESIDGDKFTANFFKSLNTIEKLTIKALESATDEEKVNMNLALTELRRWKDEGLKVANLNSINKLEQLEKFRYSKVITKKDYWRFMFKYESVYKEVNKLLKQIPTILKNLDSENGKIKSVEVKYALNEQQFPSKEDIVARLLNKYEYIKNGFELFCERFYNTVPNFVIEKIKTLTSGVFSLDLLNKIKFEFHEPSSYTDTYLFDSKNNFEQIGYENFSKEYMSFFDLMYDYAEARTEYVLLNNKEKQSCEDSSYSHKNLKNEIEEMFKPNALPSKNVQEIELMYNTKLNDNSLISKFISNLSEESVFYNSTSKFLRQLDFDSVKHFNNEYGIDVVSRKLIPLFDIADAQFIVYDLKDGTWGILHIDDKEPYSKKKTLLEVLKASGF